MARLDLGVGITAIAGALPLLDELADLLEVVEVEPQTFWWATDDPAHPYRPDAAALATLAGRPEHLLAHGVSAPVGGSVAPDPGVVALFAETVGELGAVHASEHLAFNRATGANGPYTASLFLPPSQTQSGVRAAVAGIAAYQRVLGDTPFLVETAVSYLRPRPGELPDGRYVAAVAEAADCGILLDLHNVWANERNGRQRVDDLLAQLPLERVLEVHVAGGRELGGYWLDAHSGAMPEALVALTARVLPRLPEVRAVVFEVLPDFVPTLGVAGIRRQLEMLHRLCAPRSAPTVRRRPAATVDDPPIALDTGDAAVWEHALATLAIGHEPDAGVSELAGELGADPGLGIVRTLVHLGRAGRLVAALPLTIRGLGLALGDDLLTLLERYCAETEPALWGSDEAAAFGTWVVDRELALPWLVDVVALELAAGTAVRRDEPVTVLVSSSPDDLLGALRAGVLPPAAAPALHEVTYA
jgi:uncharacterized protein